MNIQNLVSQSNLELVIAFIAAVVALRVITAISFAAGRKAGRKQVFATIDARWAAIDAEKEAFERLEETRKAKANAEAKKREEGFAGRSVRRIVRKTDRNNWMRSIEVEESLSYEHQANVEQRLTNAEAAFKAALEAYNAAGNARSAADSALEALKY